MNTPDLWNESDLLELIKNQREEDSQLDFKRAESVERSEARKDEISKDVSAFANSAGGVIVYGIEESSHPPHYAKALSPVDPTKTSKEWLEQIINSRIKPRIHGAVINTIELKSAHPGKFVYAVCIPESTTAHQASDKKYYKRFNFESTPMEDYEIRFVMNRASRPFYSFGLEVGQISNPPGATEFRFRCVIQNESEIVGHELSAVIFVPEGLVRQPDGFRVASEGIQYARIPANFIESSRAMRSAIESAHPYTPYALEFMKSIGFRTNPPPAERFRVLVCVFDQFGLALRASYYVAMQGLAIQPQYEIPGAKRSASFMIWQQFI